MTGKRSTSNPLWVAITHLLLPTIQVNWSHAYSTFNFCCHSKVYFFWRCMLEHTKRQVKVSFFFFPEVRLYFLMFISTVRFLFFLNLRWPKNKSIYDLVPHLWKTCLVFYYEGRLILRLLTAFSLYLSSGSSRFPTWRKMRRPWRKGCNQFIIFFLLSLNFSPQ